MRRAIEAGDRPAQFKLAALASDAAGTEQFLDLFEGYLSRRAARPAGAGAAGSPPAVPLVTLAELWEKAAVSGREVETTTSTAGSSCSIFSRPRRPLFARPELRISTPDDEPRGSTMADKTNILHHDADLLSERRPAYRSRLQHDRDRRDRALPAARRQGRLLPDRHRRARPQDAADGAGAGADAASSSPIATRRSSATWSTTLNCSNDDFIRTTEERHYRASQELWRRMDAAGDIYLDRYAGWYSVRQEAYFDEDETKLGDDGVRREPLGSPVEWVEEESYFFRLSAYQDRLLAHYEAQSRLHRAARAAERGAELRQGGAEGRLDLAHHLRLGRAGSGRPEARHVRLGRRAHQLHHRRRLSRRERRRSGASGRPTCI